MTSLRVVTPLTSSGPQNCKKKEPFFKIMSRVAEAPRCARLPEPLFPYPTKSNPKKYQWFIKSKALKPLFRSWETIFGTPTSRVFHSIQTTTTNNHTAVYHKINGFTSVETHANTRTLCWNCGRSWFTSFSCSSGALVFTVSTCWRMPHPMINSITPSAATWDDKLSSLDNYASWGGHILHSHKR